MTRRLLPTLLVATVLGGCGGADFSDLDAYMADMRSRPQGTIEPIPTFKPYKAFTYDAQSERAPFDPMPRFEPEEIDGDPDVKPDLRRTKEFLEGFSIESLAMVGTLEQRQERWALITDSDGGVHRVQVGNFLGMDHGRIEEISSSYVRVLEITATGTGGWVQRPRVIELIERDN